MHAHFHDHVRGQLTAEEALLRSKQAGIKGMLLSSWPGDGTKTLYGLAPGRVVPGLTVYAEDSLLVPKDRNLWMNNPQVPNLIEEQIKTNKLPYKTIGEFHVYFDTEIT